MAKQDFARKRRSGNSASPKPARQPARQAAPKRTAPPPRRTPWGLMLFTLAVLGGLGYLVYTLLQTPPETAPASATTTTVAPKPASKPTPKPAVPSQPEPEPEKSKFEFYEMLPKAEVVAPKVEAYKSTPKDAKMEHRYLLQAGSFRDPGDAERMRAKLILQGFPGVRTDRSEGSNGVWYRVRLGPFDNQTEINQAHNKLGKLNIIPMQIRID
ncbi:SPOR domain-containing protein [Marinobacterium sediminicola]|uniref:Sporulation related domain-containing protein n=1 Tax=Marinobacterium sediminicola TaxID=518898 RepID=A0ABY1S1U6_9GAMM|nr:SPOR domain-containing protein [Marinobacterium sediminicola]ULG69516.1 SPOR domain-containing protein [Marinobacterium sediminicola]SMR75667.1 Sporulation related domain-containing protein [Marinobacterium sediminicola]